MKHSITRRRVLAAGAGLAAALAVPGWASETTVGLRRRAIPGSGARIPVIGLGSWLTFDAGSVPHRRDNVRAVMQAFFDRGGGMIDSSPMYSSAQEVIGAGLSKIDNNQGLISATKVWIPGRGTGIWQMESALKLWGLESFDLLYVHNLLDWETHLPWMREWQQQGKVSHIGVTTSHGRRHGELLDVMRKEKMDCVQFTYNILDREAERRLLPVAQERGLAVIINRPFRGGSLFRRVRNQVLPGWAADIGIENWAQYFLKFIVSHPAVTCAIPATSQVAHLHENMGALSGPLPDERMRQQMIRYYESL
ncbi:MAG: aldo/keto reductase [Xanthomonadales bacterium]|nr:aldo/keto reductase [Xanthomonadales bacterium]NNL96409.1 aldo/keto reductase [Xanthomonadales bacterium]